MPTRRPRIATLAAALLLVGGLAACGDSADTQHATQTAARVNGQEITVHQVNQVLARLGGLDEQDAAKARDEVLARLIDQQLAVESARAAKLDRRPEVVAAIEAARRDTLARAYMESLVADLPPPQPDELRAYYRQHPELFSQRRIYTLQEILVDDAGVLSLLEEQTRRGGSIEEIAAWLSNKGIRFTPLRDSTRPAEQIPLEMLPALHAAHEGQVVVASLPQGIAVVRIVATQSAPISEEEALPSIRQFLINRHHKQTIDDAIASLRKQATIEYLGAFARETVPTGSTTPSPPSPAGDAARAIGDLK